MPAWPNRPTAAYVSELQSEQCRTRRQAAAALEVLADQCAVLPLIDALNDEDKDVRGNVARALGRIGGARAVEPLIALVADPSPEVRYLVVLSLWRIGDQRAIEPLIPLLHDVDSLVRYYAAQALIHPFGGDSGTPFISATGLYADVYREAKNAIRSSFSGRTT